MFACIIVCRDCLMIVITYYKIPAQIDSQTHAQQHPHMYKQIKGLNQKQCLC